MGAEGRKSGFPCAKRGKTYKRIPCAQSKGVQGKENGTLYTRRITQLQRKDPGSLSLSKGREEAERHAEYSKGNLTTKEEEKSIDKKDRGIRCEGEEPLSNGNEEVQS